MCLLLETHGESSAQARREHYQLDFGSYLPGSTAKLSQFQEDSGGASDQ
jgi:hypothetical protein